MAHNVLRPPLLKLLSGSSECLKEEKIKVNPLRKNWIS